MEAAILPAEAEFARSDEASWRHANLTPKASSSVDADRIKFGWKELSVIFGAVATILIAVWSLRADMGTLAAKFDGYRDLQNERTSVLVEQFKELKREEAMNKVLLDEMGKKVSQLEGEILVLQRKDR